MLIINYNKIKSNFDNSNDKSVYIYIYNKFSFGEFDTENPVYVISN